MQKLEVYNAQLGQYTVDQILSKNQVYFKESKGASKDAHELVYEYVSYRNYCLITKL